MKINLIEKNQKKDTFALGLFALGIILTAEFKLIATGGGGGVFFLGLSGLSFLGAAVTVMPLVAKILATALASDFFGLAGLGGGFLTESVIESDRCIILLSIELFDPPF